MQPKIFIATPMYGGQAHGTYMRGVFQLSDICRQLNWQTMLSMLSNESLITRGRNSIVHNFLKTDATHLFFVDSDIGFNPGEVAPMVTADKDIICGIYPKKEINWDGVRAAALNGVPANELRFHSGSFVINLVNYQGHEEVPMDQPLEIWNGGTGFMLIKREVFERMRPACAVYKNDVVDQSGGMAQGEPIIEYFDTSIETGTERLLSEDYHFCHTWRTRCGGKVYAAPWVTLTHTGTYTFEGRMLRKPRQDAPQVAADPAPVKKKRRARRASR
jgi:hypothetical protein